MRANARDKVRTKIISAAARLLREQGSAALTTRNVARAAAVRAPTIYRLFGDKEGLLDAVAEHVLATHASTKSELVEAAARQNTDPLEDLRAGWQMQIAFGLANPTLFALIIAPERELNSPAAQAGAAVLRTRIQRLAATGTLRVSERKALDLIRAAGTGTVLTLLATPPAARDLSLADAMYDAILREILADAPRPQGGGPAAAAIALRASTAALEALSEAERQLLNEWLDRAIDGL